MLSLALGGRGKESKERVLAVSKGPPGGGDDGKEKKLAWKEEEEKKNISIWVSDLGEDEEKGGHTEKWRRQFRVERGRRGVFGKRNSERRRKLIRRRADALFPLRVQV